jgi:Xaa-Pro dipeptidase
MQKHDLKALVATSPVNVTYFTGMDCWMYRSFRENMYIPGGPTNLKQSYAVLPADGKPILILDHFTLPFARGLEVEKRTYGPHDVQLPEGSKRSSEHLKIMLKAFRKQESSPARALTKTLMDQGIERGKVGIELQNLSSESRHALRKEFPSVRFEDSPELLRLIRMVKTKEEVLRLTKSSEINESALKTSLSLAKEGARMGEVRRSFQAVLTKNDAQFEHFIYCPEGVGITDLDDYQLGGGELTYVDCGCTYKMYYSDTGTTLMIGIIPPGILRTQKKLWESTESMFDLLRPGSKSFEVSIFLEKFLRKEGIKNCHYEGHGIGLETREHPIISQRTRRRIRDSIVNENVNITMEEGMVVNVETPVTEPGIGALHAERTFVIGKHKPTEITSWSKETPYLG